MPRRRCVGRTAIQLDRRDVGIDRAARQRQLERVVAAGADDLVALEHRDRAVELGLGPALVALGRRSRRKPKPYSSVRL